MVCLYAVFFVRSHVSVSSLALYVCSGCYLWASLSEAGSHISGYHLWFTIFGAAIIPTLGYAHAARQQNYFVRRNVGVTLFET